jgi:hypothetical protein
MHILHEIGSVTVLVLCDMGSHSAECEQVVCSEKLDAVFAGEADRKSVV